MKKGDMVEFVIEDLGNDGEGIGRANGIALFVKDAIPGDHIIAKIMKMKKSYGYARLLELLEASPNRIEPPCPIHRQCGGCQLQALTYSKQLEYKDDKLSNNLKRIGGFPDALIHSAKAELIMGAEECLYYRNKAQFPIGREKDGRLIAGFYAHRSHTMIPLPEQGCLLGPAVSKEILAITLVFMEEHKIEPYNEAEHSGLVRHVLVRQGHASGEIMVSLVINGNALPHSEELVKALSRIKGMTSITLNLNQERTNVILGEELILLWGKPYITDSIGGISYQISPLSFYQVNPLQTEKLYQAALEYAGLTGEEVVWDLYCGIGTISLFLARQAKAVYGVEIIPQAIADAKANAKRNGIWNAEFLVGKAEELPSNMPHPDVIIVDPPRKGCDEGCLETIVGSKPSRVVYVSCDTATLARDLRYLCDRGYELVKLRACDMFPQTSHVESVVLLSQTEGVDF